MVVEAREAGLLERAGEVRERLADQWRSASPSSPAEIMRFYEQADQTEDLDCFHAFPGRQSWTENLLHVVGTAKPKLVLDIGCGAGHDIRAVREQYPDVVVRGVEPSNLFRTALQADGFQIYKTVEQAPVETADVLSCFDVLEHVPDPETWLGAIAQRAKGDAILVETCSTFDMGTPLHLVENRGWHPGRVLERHGWVMTVASDRLRVWQRLRDAAADTTTLVVCAFRSVSIPTVMSLISLVGSLGPNGHRVQFCSEAGINRARSIAASRWYRETDEQVLLFIDDDIRFSPRDALMLIERAKSGYEVVCGAYPVRGGQHLSLRTFDETAVLGFGPNEPPVEIRWAATGFLAIHRKVFDALVPTLPLCMPGDPAAFWPLFTWSKDVEDTAVGGVTQLSEDWFFSQQARQAGFKVWLEPRIVLDHYGEVPFNVHTMDALARVVTANGQ